MEDDGPHPRLDRDTRRGDPVQATDGPTSTGSTVALPVLGKVKTVDAVKYIAAKSAKITELHRSRRRNLWVTGGSNCDGSSAR